MIQISEYLTTKIVKKTTVKATDETIREIVKNALDTLGHNADLNYIDVSEVTDMHSLFSCDSDDLGQSYSDMNPNISEWDVSNVESMGSMFFGCKKFNCDISLWDVSNVEDMNVMFYECYKFNRNISKWNVSKVEYIGSIFHDCPIKEEYKPHFKK